MLLLKIVLTRTGCKRNDIGIIQLTRDKYSVEIFSSRKDKRKFTNTEHSDPDSYSWYVMRVAVLRLAQQKLQQFLQMSGIEMSGNTSIV